jgi:hypothetical protein
MCTLQWNPYLKILWQAVNLNTKLRKILKCKEYNVEITNLGSLKLNVKARYIKERFHCNIHNCWSFLFKLPTTFQIGTMISVSQYIRIFSLNFPRLPQTSCTKYVILANSFHYGLFNLPSFSMFGKEWKKPFQEVHVLLQLWDNKVMAVKGNLKFKWWPSTP